jgi:hypothetical protein
MVRDPITAIEARDQGLQKLRDITKASFFWSAGLVAAFSVIAAVTIPGQSQTSSVSPASQADSSTSATQPADDNQLQGPVAGSFQPRGGGPPMVVTGGSH